MDEPGKPVGIDVDQAGGQGRSDSVGTGMGREGETLDRTWHLAKSEHSLAVAEFEHTILQLSEAFNRWNIECEALGMGEYMSQPEVSILHVIRMRDRPKSLSDIVKFLNRDDSANIQYSLRKLEKSGYVAKTPRASKRQTTYVVTEKGRKATDAFASVRESILIPLTSALHDTHLSIEEATKTMQLMIGIYDLAARTAGSYRSDSADGAGSPPPARRGRA
ncbi:MAG: winged helix DNA-binding protein [Alphaproteobacteria bacterium]